jgi:catalase
VHEEGEKLRIRPESFADHYTQARLFYRSMTKPEQRHIVGGFAFELSKVTTVAIRKRMLGRLELVDADLARQVAVALGMEGQAEKLKPAQPVRDMKPSPALSQVAKAPKSIKGKKIGVLVTDGTNEKTVAALKKAAKAEGALVQVVGPKIGGAVGKGKATIEVDHTVAGGPSVLFDAVVVAPSAAGAEELLSMAAAIDWVRDAFGHLKVIGYEADAMPLLEAAGVAGEKDAGLMAISGGNFAPFIEAAKQHRIWDREPKVRKP